MRICAHHAKRIHYDQPDILRNYKYTVALPAPSLYSQFNNLEDINIVLTALLYMGFDDVFEVAAAAEIVSEIAQDYISQMHCFLRRWLWGCDKIQEGEQTMQFIKELFSVNEILTVSIVGWFVAQVLKTIINFILLGKFQLERMWGDGGMPSAHSATVCAMVIAAARSEGVSSAIFAVASVVAIITMHDAMGVRHETGEQAKVLNQMIEEWIDISEKNSPFLQNMHLKEMVGHTPLQVVAGMVVGIVVGCLYPMHLL